jgi:hypothetical protein
MAASYGQLGIVARARGDLQVAEILYRRCLEISERLGNQVSMATSLSSLGDLKAIQGDAEGAIGLHGQAMVIRRAIGLPSMAVDVWQLVGHRTAVGDDALLRALDDAVGPEGAAAIVAILDQAARTDDST